MYQGMPNRYKFRHLSPELSVEMFEEHWKLYEAYCQHLNSTLTQLSNPYDQSLIQNPNPVDGKLRELHQNKSFLSNAVNLHELFFENVILPENTNPMKQTSRYRNLLLLEARQLT